MRFVIEQELYGRLEEVECAFVDPAFLARLAELPKLGTPELLSQERTGSVVRQQVRYRFTGDLSPAVTRILDRNKLSWIEESTCHCDVHRTDWRVRPDHYADRLVCWGTFQLREDGQNTVRVASGELRVQMPFVGGRVERAIVSGMREHAQAESEVMTDWLAARR